MNSIDWKDQLLTNNNPVTKLLLITSSAIVLAFFLVAVAFPSQRDLFTFLFPKEESHAATNGSATITQQADGEDWSMPAGTGMANNSGQYWMSVQRATNQPRGNNGLNYGVMILFSWAAVNPSEGVYDWSKIDQIVSQVEAAPSDVGFVLWPFYGNRNSSLAGIKAASGGEIPQWVLNKYNIPFLRKGWSDTTKTYTEVLNGVAAWHPDSQFEQAVRPFIKALGDKYKNNPRLITVEVRSPMDDCCGEWGGRGVSGSGVEMYDEIWGLNGYSGQKDAFIEKFRTWGKSFFDDWSYGFSGKENKLATVISSEWWGAPLARELAQYAYAKGWGERDGGRSGTNLSPNILGTIVDANGYMNYNEDFPPVKNRSYFAAEEEEFTNDDTFGPADTNYYRFQYSILQQLARRRNWLSTSDYVWDSSEYHPLWDWARLSVGKTVYDSADAWAWVETSVLPDWEIANKSIPTNYLKNTERWLYQRDVTPDGVTAPDDDMSGAFNAGAFKYTAIDQYRSRKTQVASGNKYMYFNLDDRFLPSGSQTIDLKVTYRDVSATDWAIEYTNQSGIVTTPTVHTGGTMKYKTVTFRITDFVANRNLFSQSMDFRVVALGTKDISIEMVRVVKTQLASATVTPTVRPTNTPVPTITSTPTLNPTQTPNPTPTSLPTTGGVLYERWDDITTYPYSDIFNLTDDKRFPNKPSYTAKLGRIETPQDIGTNLGVRMRTLLSAPQTGNYTFAVTADDAAEVWLSTDGTSATRQKIAEVPEWTYPDEWTKYTSQTSNPIQLIAGKKYFVEILQTESVGADSVTLAWIQPGSTTREIIPDQYFSAPTVASPSADLNIDGRVDVFDLGILAAHYGQTIVSSSDTPTYRSDVNGDNTINVFDLGLLIGQYSH
ncbi:hypothetical protein HGA91_02725 [candidate division WWE3 bacterium]|nr:hypothetical protein [candidate division WWE3 bacterium]